MAWRKVTMFVAAAAGALLFATPALGAAAAADQNITLNPDHQGETAAGFDKHNCTGPLAGAPAGKDGWHFILPSATGEDFVSADLTFSDGSPPDIHVIVDNVPPGGTDSGTGWDAFFDATGSGAWKHLFVVTDAGWTLVNGSGVATRDDGTYNKTTFNLSHTCPADQVPPCEVDCGPPPCDPEIDECNPPDDPCEDEVVGAALVAQPADTCTSTSPPTCDPASQTCSPSSGTHPPTGLSLSGGSLIGVVLAGVALIAGGTALIVFRRRRDATESLL